MSGSLPLLDSTEARILGALIEKEMTTPEYYPLSLNALTTACNQTTNRYPVTHFDETSVEDALERLRQKGLVHVVHKADSRVTRYRHVAQEMLGVDAPKIAALCILLLRGPQTAGEIRTRSSRLFAFADLESLDAVLQKLSSRPEPLVARLPRIPGQKEIRYAQLLSSNTGFDRTPSTLDTDDDRISKLETLAEELRRDLDDLRGQFDQLRRQLE